MVNYRKLEMGDQQKLIGIFKQPSANFDFHKFDPVSLAQDERIDCIVVENDGEVAGFASLITYQVPTKGWVGRIEDVIVDEKFRGMGLGRGLMEKLIEIAKEKELEIIDLTSNPQRTEARKLYESLGFEIRETGVFRLKISNSKKVTFRE